MIRGSGKGPGELGDEKGSEIMERDGYVFGRHTFSLN